MRVSTFPRSDSGRRSGRRCPIHVCRRTEAVPMRAFSRTGSSSPPPAVAAAPLGMRRASAGSIRAGTAATTSSSGEAVGISLKECTATSIAPSSSARSISRTNTPCGPMAAKVGAVDRSPMVDMIASSESWPAASSRGGHTARLSAREMGAAGADAQLHGRDTASRRGRASAGRAKGASGRSRRGAASLPRPWPPERAA